MMTDAPSEEAAKLKIVEDAQPSGDKPSKNALKKAQKEAEKAAKKAAAREKERQQKMESEASDNAKDNYGQLPLVAKDRPESMFNCPLKI